MDFVRLIKNKYGGYVQQEQTGCPSPTPPRHQQLSFFVVLLWEWTKLKYLFNLSPPIGPQVLEVAFCLLLAALVSPARSEAFMCQWVLFFREAELNINSPRRTTQEVESPEKRENSP